MGEAPRLERPTQVADMVGMVIGEGLSLWLCFPVVT